MCGRENPHPKTNRGTQPPHDPLLPPSDTLNEAHPSVCWVWTAYLYLGLPDLQDPREDQADLDQGSL